jgi:hypothetical protein
MAARISKSDSDLSVGVGVEAFDRRAYGRKKIVCITCYFITCDFIGRLKVLNLQKNIIVTVFNCRLWASVMLFEIGQIC